VKGDHYHLRRVELNHETVWELRRSGDGVVAEFHDTVLAWDVLEYLRNVPAREETRA
jgi:hypothetical protein